MKKHFPAIAADVVLVLIFCAIGRRSHDEGGAITGLLHTAWPFLGGLAVGWASALALYKDKFTADSIFPTGVVVWLSTLVIGMVLRVISGQGTAFSFIIVAGVVLAAFLVGWRAIYRQVEERRALR
ncbi:DUF3054 domain-containing protein [Antrihabitans cavernicola]|uniref:DUF3054 domain-containing protein n=1 Tax=Antrihabitans cavernicola TaxID=2495913 RepID=A0A5A7S7Y4_9NOCA|nr:DUF3054 domain-containing protein [Spelaeibacter cavernicola]KAA0019392.1 DUF3054 domain-containing protein [Spelaeibacter cavernicola]